MNIPRPEHPRPQFVRESWINLNGLWSFDFDFGVSGMDAGRELYNSTGFKNEIIVPFCPESPLSGVGHTDFINQVWYHRTIAIPADWCSKCIILHFGGVDYECEAFIDGKSVGIHHGGTCSFEFDITSFVSAGSKHNLVVRARDEQRGANQPYGKQCFVYKSHGCSYTRTTGIWQTVWLEAVNPCGLKRCCITPDFDGGRFIITPEFYQVTRGLNISAALKDNGSVISETSAAALSGVPLVLDIPEPRAWSPDDPYLYDIVLTVRDGDTVLDTVCSYAGLRKIHIEGNQVFLNNEPLYQRLVLDQGFYPDGIWTAPSDEGLKRDIELSMAAGFNGARLHQKVFEERFHYWADRLGYLTWGEFASWGCDPNTEKGERDALKEWGEIILRDRNHPSIITWTPFNETWGVSNPAQHRRTHESLYDLCHALDPTRPVNDTSGGFHYKTDIWAVHNYEADGEKLREILAPNETGDVWSNYDDKQKIRYCGQPYLLDEFGGIKWTPEDRREYANNSWGYGNAPQTLEEFYTRLEKQVAAILSLPHITGFCYTQLTDVEQEENGIYNYDRTQKFDMQRIKAIFTKLP
jgi:beta-galactosidase/beta-glucuronidase